MHVFFEPNITEDAIILSEEESKHCIRVLRLKNGDEIFIANGIGHKIKTVIVDDNPKKCKLQIVENVLVEPNKNYYLHIIISPTKNSERTDWFIEKATEIGINEITFIETKNSERSKINLDRCQKIAISAMKQSKQWWLPKINTIVKYNQAINLLEPNQINLIAWCETNKEVSFKTALHNLNNTTQKPVINILIGPEGDFTSEEVNLAQAKNFKPISFGSNILRTETAAIYATSAIKTLLT